MGAAVVIPGDTPHPTFPRPSTIVFRDWRTLSHFVGNARVAVAADEWLLHSFAESASSRAAPEFCGRVWPSFHHAAISLCSDILVAVENGIDQMKLADLPRRGELPEELLQKLRVSVVADFDAGRLQHLCAVEATLAGLDTDTWRPPTPQYSGDFKCTIAIEPTPGDDENPPTTAKQLHLDCFYMLSALSGARPVEQ
jgi:hypothetical protein